MHRITIEEIKFPLTTAEHRIRSCLWGVMPLPCGPLLFGSNPQAELGHHDTTHPILPHLRPPHPNPLRHARSHGRLQSLPRRVPRHASSTVRNPLRSISNPRSGPPDAKGRTSPRQDRELKIWQTPPLRLLNNRGAPADDRPAPNQPPGVSPRFSSVPPATSENRTLTRGGR